MFNCVVARCLVTHQAHKDPGIVCPHPHMATEHLYLLGTARSSVPDAYYAVMSDSALQVQGL
jgi:hypothetical protein